MSFIHCKHYSGREMFLGAGKCRAGIDPVFSFCGGERTGWVKKVPCLRTNETTAVCPAAEYPTREEVDQADAEFKAHVEQVMKNMFVARPVIERQHEETGAWAGQVECPQCAKPLHWSKARCNGHVHARCETDNCIAWME